MKNKTLATWLSFLGGSLGLHRFYLYGKTDVWAWLLLLPTALGLYGLYRVRRYGLDDPASWVLLPVLGLALASGALQALVYGLTAPEPWNQRFNPSAPAQAAAGQTNWLTISAVALALLLGTTALMSSLAFGFQRYFEYQVEEAKKISQ